MIILGLDKRTRIAMTEFFRGSTCIKCNQPAERYLSGRYLCHNCTKGIYRFGEPEEHMTVPTGTNALGDNYTSKLDGMLIDDR